MWLSVSAPSAIAGVSVHCSFRLRTNAVLIAVAVLLFSGNGCGPVSDEERRAKALEIVKRMEQEFPGKTEEELIDMLRPTRDYRGLDAHVASHLNDAILRALRARGEQAAVALQKHCNDERELYRIDTSAPEYPSTIGEACQDILDDLGTRERTPFREHGGRAVSNP